MTLTPAFLPDDDISGLTADPRVAQALQDHDEGKIGYIRLLRVVRSVVAQQAVAAAEGKWKTLYDDQAARALKVLGDSIESLHAEYAPLVKAEKASQSCPDCVYCSVHRQRGDNAK